jgi:hypothetical protein
MANKTKELRELIKDLKETAPDLRKEVRGGFREIGQPVVVEARRRASWSRRIPGAISLKIAVSGKKVAIDLRTSIKKAPHARAYENNGQFGVFRHPVFGKDVWVSERARPFLWPAAEPMIKDVNENVGEFIDTVTKRRGFH